MPPPLRFGRETTSRVETALFLALSSFEVVRQAWGLHPAFGRGVFFEKNSVILK